MKTLVFEASPNHVLLLDGGREIRGGSEFQVSDARAVDLLSDWAVPVRESESDLRRQTRAQLDRLAERAGIVDPSDLPSKGAVIAALNEASLGSQPEPEARQGEGQTTSQEA